MQAGATSFLLSADCFFCHGSLYDRAGRPSVCLWLTSNLPIATILGDVEPPKRKCQAGPTSRQGRWWCGGSCRRRQAERKKGRKKQKKGGRWSSMHTKHHPRSIITPLQAVLSYVRLDRHPCSCSARVRRPAPHTCRLPHIAKPL